MADVGGDQRDGGDEVGTIGCEQARDAVAEGVAGEECWARSVSLAMSRFDDGCDILGAVLEVLVAAAVARADAARLGTQHAKAGSSNCVCDRVEVLRTAPERGQHDDERAIALRQDFNHRDVLAADDEALDGV